MKIDELISFCRLMLQFGSVERTVSLPNQARHENDVEHSYMLAMTAWYIASSQKDQLKLDVDLVVKYALAHDLVEVYAGDTFIYDSKKAANKLIREHHAAEALMQNYPGFDELHQLISQYEAQNDPESRFVYALDKILPIIVIYIGQGATWHEHKITLDMLHQHKQEKVRASAIVAELYEQLRSRLLQRPELFPELSPKS